MNYSIKQNENLTYWQIQGPKLWQLVLFEDSCLSIKKQFTQKRKLAYIVSASSQVFLLQPEPIIESITASQHYESQVLSLIGCSMSNDHDIVEPACGKNSILVYIQMWLN